MSHYLHRYWGKADNKYKGDPKWHPLAYHCLDVAACGQVLLRQQPAWLDNLVRLSGIEPAALTPWLVFLLSIHDLGKFGDGFQSLRQDLQQELKGRGAQVAYDVRHDTLGYALVMEHLPGWLERHDLAERGGNLLRLWVAAVTGHHGRPPKNESLRAHVARHFPADSVLKEVGQFVADMRRLLLPENQSLPTRAEGALECYKRASWMVAGLAVATDWLGSNTRWFKYHRPDQSPENYWHQVALPTAETAVAESGMLSSLPALDATFAKLFPHIAATPTPLQLWADKIPIKPGPQLFVLEELTGGGKTEAALTLAARLMAAGCGSGVYFALPTMATSDAMFDRVQWKQEGETDEPWQRFFADGEPSLVLAHSAAKTKQKLDALVRCDAGYGDRREEASASQHCTDWLADSRKKALLADFGVGTVDQALLGVMPLRHQSLRLLGLSSKVLVVDEVHACDAYMGELLERLLYFHAGLGGSAILLSATLPQNQRARLLTAFAEGAGFDAKVPKKEDYPLVSHRHSDDLGETPIQARMAASRQVMVEPLATEEMVFHRLQATIARGACGVWVRNTVADAVAAWRAWTAKYPGHPATLFHARFALCDRLRISQEITKSFNKESKPATRSGRLVIATQVVEQSLDVDFDDMVTDLAPIDLVVQRAGRLQRHKRDAEGNIAQFEGRGGTKLGVLMPEPTEDAPAGWFKRLLPKAAKVYADHGRLWLTAHWLVTQQGFELPRDAREMIETVYGDTGFSRIPIGLQKSSDARQGACFSERSLARQIALSFGQGYDPTSLNWPDEDAQADISTRLGEKTVRLRLARICGDRLKPWATTGSAIDWSLSELTVPRYLVAMESPRYSGLITQARKEMWDEGRHCLIVPLEKTGDEWRGLAKNERDEDIRVIYSPQVGLSIEKGEPIDESDL